MWGGNRSRLECLARIKKKFQKISNRFHRYTTVVFLTGHPTVGCCLYGIPQEKHFVPDLIASPMVSSSIRRGKFNREAQDENMKDQSAHKI